MATNTVLFTTYQGSTFTKNFYLKDSLGEKILLSNFNFRGSIRSRTDNTLIGDFEFQAIDEYFVNMFITATNSAGMLAGLHKFDVEMFTTGDAYVEKIMIGTIEILEEVTI